MIMYLLLSDTTVKVTFRGCIEIRTKPVPVRACCPQAAVPAGTGARRHCQPARGLEVMPAGSGARRHWCPQAVLPAGNGARRQWCPWAL